MSELEELRQRCAELERERDVYKKAKAGNDDRFMIERDIARARLTAAETALRFIVDNAHTHDYSEGNYHGTCEECDERLEKARVYFDAQNKQGAK